MLQQLGKRKIVDEGTRSNTKGFLYRIARRPSSIVGAMLLVEWKFHRVSLLGCERRHWNSLWREGLGGKIGLIQSISTSSKSTNLKNKKN